MLYKEKDQIQIHKFLEKSFTDSEPELSSIADPPSRRGVDMAQVFFFDLSNRYAGLDAKNGPLAKVEWIIAARW